MYSEERERRVGEGIDQVATQGAAAGDQLEVLTSKRHDANATSVGAGHLGDSVGMQAGTVDQHAGLHDTRRTVHFDDAAALVDGLSRRSGADLHTLPGQDSAQRVAHFRVVHDAGGWHVEAGDSFGMRLELAQSSAVEAGHPDAVGIRPVGERVESGKLERFGRDDDLPAHLVVDRVCIAKTHQLLAAVETHPRLERSRCVVEPGVDHT